MTRVDCIFKYFFYFFFLYLMQIISIETICMKCKILFSGENKKGISLSSAEFAKRVVKIKRDL